MCKNSDDHSSKIFSKNEIKEETRPSTTNMKK